MLYEAGWGAIGLGIFVLMSYWARSKQIGRASQPLLKRKAFYAWLVSALITVACFVSLIWFWSEKRVTKLVFVVGMYIFMCGAIAWPWVLHDIVTPLEVMALLTTAVGSSLLFVATIHTMAVPLTAYILFHHLFVDAIWWPLYGRAI